MSELQEYYLDLEEYMLHAPILAVLLVIYFILFDQAFENPIRDLKPTLPKNIYTANKETLSHMYPHQNENLCQSQNIKNILSITKNVPTL